MAFGPLIHGHGDPTIRRRVTDAIDRGWSYGTAEESSLALAELVTGEIPWVEQIRFMNLGPGTEAVMTALRIARGVTGRDRIVKFAGCYHGHSDSVLIRAGSGLASQPDSAGIPAGVAADTLVAKLDDEQSVERLFDDFGAEIAAVVIEPMPANHGLLPQRRAFLLRLRDLCTRHGAVLIFDEVISGFRVGFTGYAGLCKIEPDLVTYGKIIGGGFPVGAVGGHAQLMQSLAPAGPVYQAGTLRANPVAMAAGLASLELLTDGRVYTHLEQLGRSLDCALADIDGVSLQRIGSVFWFAFGAEPGAVIRRPRAIQPKARSCHVRFFHAALAAGLYLPPSPFETGFLSLAHRQEHIDALIRVLAAQLHTRRVDPDSGCAVSSSRRISSRR